MDGGKVRFELRHGLEQAGIAPAAADRIAEYGAMLLEANRRVNLTGAKTAAELLPHLVDSASIAGEIRGRYVDVGSGGGLPAFPAAIIAGVEVTLIESIVKKSAFLRAALTRLEIGGRVVSERAELAGREPDLREQFETATARAVSTAPTVAEFLLPLLRVGGRAVLQRGGMEQRERDALGDAALMLGGRIVEERVLERERRLIIVSKEVPTPERFPRRPGIPEKRPLCM